MPTSLNISEPPDRAPDFIWQGQMTDLDGNNNKIWRIQTYEPENIAFVEYGRAPIPNRSNFYALSSYRVQSTIRSKEKKGYVYFEPSKETDVVQARQKLGLAIVPADGDSELVLPTVDTHVLQLVDLLWEESGDAIKESLAGDLNLLSLAQIDKGRNAVAKALDAYKAKDKSELQRAVTLFYKTIPTKLPHRINKDDVIEEFVRKIGSANGDSHEDRLNELETAVAMSQVTNISGNTSINNYVGLGATINRLDKHALAYEQIVKFIRVTRPHQTVLDIFLLEIPQEREAFKAEYHNFAKLDRLNVQTMFHASRNNNFRHILHTGLKIPQTKANGWRFGAGIYFSDAAHRSYQYTGRSRYGSSKPVMMLVNDVAIGKPFVSSGDDHSLRKAPAGYDSVHGTGAWSNNGDEFIVYRASQQTARAIVLLD